MQRWSFVPVLACLLASLTSAQADLGPLVALDAKPGDLFGTSVALSGERALVGAPAHDAASTDDGAAYVFERPSGVWSQAAKLVPSDPAAGTCFGTAVALSGDRAAVTRLGALGTPGAAYVFELQAGVWVETAKIVNPGSWAFSFGASAALEGTTLLVGATGSGSTFNCGTVYAYELWGGVWAGTGQLPPPFCTFPSNIAVYGGSVALSGDRALVGKKVLIGMGGETVPGYSFERSGGAWTFVEEVAAGSTSASAEVVVALDGDYALLGLPLTFGSSGRLELFRHTSTLGWNWEDFINGVGAGTELGRSVALDGARALAGAPGDDAAGTDAGAVYAFTLGLQFGELKFLTQTKLLPAGPAAGDAFGAAAALSGDLLLLGAPRDDGTGTDAGAAQAFSALPFDASPEAVSVGAGGSQVLKLGAGAAQGGALFAILGSLSGTVPGQTLGGMLVPLNPDPYLTYTLVHPGQFPLQDGLGLLDPGGKASAGFALPAGANPALIGLTVHHAFVLVDLGTLSVTLASNAEPALLLP